MKSTQSDSNVLPSWDRVSIASILPYVGAEHLSYVGAGQVGTEFRLQAFCFMSAPT
jgi:hypothetical protein